MKSAAQAFKDKDWSGVIVENLIVMVKQKLEKLLSDWDVQWVVFEINLLGIFTRIFTWFSYISKRDGHLRVVKN